MSDAPSPRPLMSDETVLPAECGRQLGLAVLAVMKMLGKESMQVDEDDDVGLIKLARVGSGLVIVERYGDPAKGKPHRYTCYRIAEAKPGGLFKLDPDAVLFVLHEQGFYSPPDWELDCIIDPRAWFNTVMVEIHLALEPVAPRAN